MVSSEINSGRFARYIVRVLNDARARGMSDADIHLATGVSPATFHRWKSGDFKRAPFAERVVAFCRALGAPAEPALMALGLMPGKDDPAPEPVIDPDVRRVLRLLADPNVPDEEKAIIRGMLRMMGGRRGAGRPVTER